MKMDPFLKQIATQLVEKYGKDMREVTVVFNNRRSGLFLQKHLAKITEGAFYAPSVIGIDDLVMKLGGKQIVASEFLLFELFKVHRSMEADRKFNTFEEFIPFGEMLLSDFSEVDSYCVDAKSLFGNIYALKQLGEWRIGEQQTERQAKYLKFYESLYEYYDKLHKALDAKGQAYSGMAYRYVAEHIDDLVDNYLPKKAIYFVGFNALTECERRIAKAYVKRGVGHMITDGDAYYYNIMGDHEAGHFLRKHKADFDEIGNYAEHFAEGFKKIKIVKCAEDELQAKYVAKVLEQTAEDGKPAVAPEDTAIVLADEGLLLPVLNSLPENITAANVTMGFPFTNSSAHALALKLFSLYLRARNGAYYHQDLMDIFSDGLVSRLMGVVNVRSTLMALMKENKAIFADMKIMQGWAEAISKNSKVEFDLGKISFLFDNPTPSPKDFLDNLRRLTIALYESKVFASNQKETEALACLLQIVDHFVSLMKAEGDADKLEIENLSTLQKIYLRFAQRRSIAFYGEPLSGLQILGVLETRNLDFKKVVMLSTNESILPAGRGHNTLIPYELKKEFKIPTYREKDAVYAYHFYRFLQRAEEVVLVYNADIDGPAKGEPSRFILQVKEELARRYEKQVELSELSVTAMTSPALNLPPLNGTKTAAVMQRLWKMADKGFSPSALNNYKHCQMKFYYENVLRAKAEEGINDDLDQSELGTCIHNVLEHLYGQGEVVKADLAAKRKNLTKIIKDEFEKLFQNGTPHQGRNALLQSVADKQIGRFVDKELEDLDEHKIVVQDLEKKMSQPMTIEVAGKECTVNVSGIADRVDKRDGVLRMIDYKTGKVEEADVKYTREDLAAGNPLPDKVLQLMIYSWLWSEELKAQGKPMEPVVPAIAPLKNLNEGYYNVDWMGESCIKAPAVEEFEKILKGILEEIMDKNVPFAPNGDSGLCGHCPVSRLCPSAKLS